MRDERDDAVRFRPATRRRNRIAAGVALVAVAVAINAALYTSLDDATPAVQTTRDILAGEQITADAVRTVDVDVDPTVGIVDGDDIDLVVGQFAKVRIVSGSLVSEASLQSEPLVAEGASVVALTVPEGSLPTGLRERAPVVLVIPPKDADGSITSIAGRVVGIPSETTVTGAQSISVEVAAADAPTVAAADDVRVVLAAPTADPATDPATAPGRTNPIAGGETDTSETETSGSDTSETETSETDTSDTDTSDPSGPGTGDP